MGASSGALLRTVLQNTALQLLLLSCPSIPDSEGFIVPTMRTLPARGIRQHSSTKHNISAILRRTISDGWIRADNLAATTPEAVVNS
jgi:hypothetical protein